MYIIFAILLFGFLIAIHEFGHFIVAKTCKVKVNEFSIGMGPLIFSRQGEETLYSLRLLPIGGFCAMEGEDGDSDDERAFSKAAGWKRFLILIAGSAFNFLTGLIIVMCIYSGAATYTEPVLAGFMEGFPLVGEEYLMEGDEIYAINGKRVLLTNDVSTILAVENSSEVDVTVRRDGELITIEDLPLVPREYEENGQTIQRYGLYFSAHEASFGDKVKMGLYTTVNFVRNVFWSFEMLFEGSAGFNDLSGPVGIVQTMNEVGESSATVLDAIVNLLYFGAFVAVNLSVMNLLPIPALDGGRIFLMLINGLCMLLFRRRIPEKVEGAIHFVFLILLFGLMAAVLVNDVYKIIA